MILVLVGAMAFTSDLSLVSGKFFYQHFPKNREITNMCVWFYFFFLCQRSNGGTTGDLNGETHKCTQNGGHSHQGNDYQCPSQQAEKGN